MSLRDYLFHEEPGITLYCGDCRDVLPLLPRECAVAAKRLRQEVLALDFPGPAGVG